MSRAGLAMSGRRLGLPGGGRRRLRVLTGEPHRWRRSSLAAVVDVALARPRRSALGCAAIAAGAAAATAGPVAAEIAATYAAVAVVVVVARRRAARQATEVEQAAAAVGRAAAELRAGAETVATLATVSAMSAPEAPWTRQMSDAGEPITRSTPWVPTTTADRDRSAPRADGDTPREAAAASLLVGRIEAARRVAEDTGAPLADLLDRLEADARATVRARASATAQASGAQATAWLLAALPAAGIALGSGIGADPVHVLLHTPLGALCATAAMALQIAGLAWVHRLAASITAVA